MKKTILTWVVPVLCLLGSCQKVIDIDLNATEKRIIVEAEITDDPDYPNRVSITQSVDFDEESEFPSIENASVLISDDQGNSYALSHVGNGVYENASLVGVSGRTYTLSIIIDGKTYSAVSKMPAKVPFESIAIEDGGGFGPAGGSLVIPVFQDPIGVGNNYRFYLWNNDEKSKDIMLINDEIIDGGLNNSPLRTQNMNFNGGDTAKVVMMCIDKPVYDYFYGLTLNGSGPGSSASPANPTSNISGGVLGYFSAHTRETKSVIVP